MAMPQSRVTTSASLRGNRGEMCAICKERKPVTVRLEGTGTVCADCDPKKGRKALIEVVEDDRP